MFKESRITEKRVWFDWKRDTILIHPVDSSVAYLKYNTSIRRLAMIYASQSGILRAT